MMRALALWALVVVSGAAGAAAQLHLRVNGKEAETHWLPITQEAGTQNKVAAHAAFSAQVVPDGMVGLGAKLTWTVGAPLAVPAEGATDWEDNVHLDDIDTVAVSVRAQCDNPVLDITVSTTVKTFGGPYKVVKRPWHLCQNNQLLSDTWGEVDASAAAPDTALHVSWSGDLNNQHEVLLWPAQDYQYSDRIIKVAAHGPSDAFEPGGGEPFVARYEAPDGGVALWTNYMLVRSPTSFRDWTDGADGFVYRPTTGGDTGYESRFRHVLLDQFGRPMVAGKAARRFAGGQGLQGALIPEHGGCNWSEYEFNNFLGICLGPLDGSAAEDGGFVGEGEPQSTEGFCVFGLRASAQDGMVPAPYGPSHAPDGQQDTLDASCSGGYCVELPRLPEDLMAPAEKAVAAASWWWHRSYARENLGAP